MSDPYEREAAKAAIKVLQRELAEAREEIENLNKIIDAATNSANASHFRAIEYQNQRDTLAKALSMYGLPYSDDDLEHVAQNPSPHSEIGTHEAKRELIRRKALAAVKGGSHE
jgi:hypothetical protein